MTLSAGTVTSETRLGYPTAQFTLYDRNTFGIGVKPSETNSSTVNNVFIQYNVFAWVNYHLAFKMHLLLV